MYQTIAIAMCALVFGVPIWALITRRRDVVAYIFNHMGEAYPAPTLAAGFVTMGAGTINRNLGIGVGVVLGLLLLRSITARRNQHFEPVFRPLFGPYMIRSKFCPDLSWWGKAYWAVDWQGKARILGKTTADYRGRSTRNLERRLGHLYETARSYVLEDFSVRSVFVTDDAALELYQRGDLRLEHLLQATTGGLHPTIMIEEFFFDKVALVIRKELHGLRDFVFEVQIGNEVRFIQDATELGSFASLTQA